MTSTIYALSTPPGRGGLAVIRISGPGTVDILRGLGIKSDIPARTALLRAIHDPRTNEILDRAVVTFFQGPASFTGEDTAEISLHGGRAIIDGVLSALSTFPHARMAEPGEFTRRAFLNDKLDLTAAEGVADLIHAETAMQRRQALAQMGGSLQTLYDGWRAQLIRAAAYLEAHLDFADEDLPPDLHSYVTPVLDTLKNAITAHLNDNNRGERLRDGVRVVIFGAPNAGKSSLLNALSKRDVAIVSDIAGTTRDVLDVHLDLGGYPVTLTDTAGLRDGQDTIEAEGIKRARARVDTADIKIALIDAATLPHIPSETSELIDAQTVIVLNKADIAGDISGQTGIPLSAATGTGIDTLIQTLTARIADIFGRDEGTSPTRARHRAALNECVHYIDVVLADTNAADHPELVAEELRAAGAALARITGRIDVEDLLDVIFRDFCIGK